MNVKLGALALSGLILLLTACMPIGSSTVVKPLTISAAATVTRQTPTEARSAGQSRYEGQHFSLEYPSTLILHENERPSTDGVVTPLENSIVLQDSRFLLIVTSFDIVPGTGLAEFVEGHLECVEVEANGGQEIKLGEVDARLYADTLCGLHGTTYFYAVHGRTGYRLALESGDPFPALLSQVQPILDSFRMLDTSASMTQIEHEGTSIVCPDNMGQACWVTAETSTNEPIVFFSGDGWKEVSGEYVSFRVPIEWTPRSRDLTPGSVLAEWHLGIPGIESDQVLAFSSVMFDALRPADVVSEAPFEIGGQPGVKWVRAGDGYVSYDYSTEGIAGAGSFGIHVTVPEADSELEAVMDALAASVTFSP